MSSTASSSLCGGSVISQHAVLTAAHCTLQNVQSFLVIAGAYNRNRVEENQQRRTVPASGFVPHPNYNPFRLLNDIAILHIDQPFVFNRFVQPVAIASNDQERFVGTEVAVSGKFNFNFVNKKKLNKFSYIMLNLNL